MNAKQKTLRHDENEKEIQKQSQRLCIYNREIRTEISLSPPFANEARRSHSRIVRSRG